MSLKRPKSNYDWESDDSSHVKTRRSSGLDYLNESPRSSSLRDYFNPNTSSTSSWSDTSMDENLGFFLPQSLIDEIAAPNQPSIEKFEQCLSTNNIEGAWGIVKQILSDIPDPRERGKMYRALSESAKRLSEIKFSLELYTLCTNEDSTTPTSWIDKAKLLDEIGEVAKAEEVLKEGVHRVTHSDQLIRKILRSYERMSLFDKARTYLSELIADKSIDRESVLVEGGLFELRQGHYNEAMIIFNSIKTSNGWKPTVYSELVQYFERTGIIESNFSIVNEGITRNPRNAALFLVLLRHQSSSAKAISLLYDNSPKWTAEFKDKMTTSLCEILASRGDLIQTRQLLAEQVSICSPRQRYKLFLTAAATELAHGDSGVVPLLLDLALRQTPLKSRPIVLVLIAKVHELNKDYAKAQDIYERAIKDFSGEWRVFIEFAFFWLHRNEISKAIGVLQNALVNHSGSGRLWAFRVQLEGFISSESQVNILKLAIKAVPKSGEVWCEAARIALNPMTKYFNLDAAKQYLEFASRFTPQHGDSMVEMIRVELLRRGLHADLTDVLNRFVSSEGNYGLLFLFVRPSEEASLTEVFENAVKLVRQDLMDNSEVYQRAIARSSFVLRSVNEEKEKLKKAKKLIGPGEFAFGLTSLKKIELNPDLCTNRTQCINVVVGTVLFSQS